MRYCEFLYHLYFWSKLSSKLGISDFCKSYLIKRKCYHDSQLWAQFIPKVQVVQQLTIPHLKALVVDNDILEGQGRGSLKRLPQPFFLKSTLFTNSGRGKPLTMPRPSSSRIKMSSIRAFQWGIICSCTIIGSPAIWRKPKLMFEVYHSNRSPLYMMLVFKPSF